MSFQNLKEFFLSNPNNIFLVDGLGALVSAFLLVVVSLKFENHFGIPVQMLYILAFLPCVLVLFDLYCFTRIKKDKITFLKILSFINISYCFTALGLAGFYYKKITYLGWTYIFLEMVIVISIASLEYKTADFLKKKEGKKLIME